MARPHWPATAHARRRAAAAAWLVAAVWATFGPHAPDTSRLLVGLAVVASVAALTCERDERAQESIRMAYWAGTLASRPATLIPEQRAENARERA